MAAKLIAGTCRQASAEPLFRGRKLIMNYTDGSPCDDSSDHLLPRKLNGDDDDEDNDRDDDRKPHKGSSDREPARRKSTLIAFSCDRDSLAPKAHVLFLGTLDECTYSFEVRSMAACGGVIDPQQSLGPGGVFGVIALIAAAVYLLGGIAYQRTVMHQRGWRQLPNYTLWAGIFAFIHVCIPTKGISRYRILIVALQDIFIILTSSCARLIPRQRGYNQLPTISRGRSSREEENGK